MSSFNLALLPPSERHEIEMGKQASMLVYELRSGKLKRKDAMEQISNHTNPDRFRELVNKYRSL